MSGSAPDRATPAGSFDVLGGQRKQYEGVVDVEKLFNIDERSLTEEEEEVVNKDEFIIAGRASIEQFDIDDPPQKIRMEAFDDSLDQFFSQGGLITRRHKDVPVGEALRSYTVDESTEINLEDGSTLSLSSGDTLRTRIIRKGEDLPGNNGTADEDLLWVVANIFGENDDRGSTMSKQTRLGIYHGMLDGFSVTIFSKQYAPRDEGHDVLEVDFHAITIGDEKLVKNPGSSFDFVEMKLSDPYGAEMSQYIQAAMSNKIYNFLFSKSKENLAVETIKVAQKEEVPLDEAAGEVASEDADVESITEEAAEKLAYMEEQLDEKQNRDRRDLASDVADELGMSTGEVLEVFDQLEGGEEGEEEGEEEGGGMSQEMIEEKLDEKVESTVEETIEEKLEEKNIVTEEDIEGLATKEDLEEGLDDAADDIADGISEKLNVEGTPDPSGDPGGEEVSVESEIDDLVKKFE